MAKVDASKWFLLPSMPLGRVDTRVWLFSKKGGEGASVFTVGTTLLSAPFPTVVLTDGLLHTHMRMHTYTHTCAHTQQTTCTHSTLYATLYSCQRFPLYKIMFSHCSFVNDLFRCCLLLSLYINRESAVCSYTEMKGGGGEQENMATSDVLNKTLQVQTASGHSEDLRLAWGFTVPGVWR